jgi:L-threonylcarbamoyladenylate synthase
MPDPNVVLSALETQNIDKAAQILNEGGLVAFPTETVYGLGADALNAKAIARVFEIKKRPDFDPLIVHVSKPGEARLLWKDIPKGAELLIAKFWPGPLTIVLPKSDRVPDIVTCGLPTVAVRMPNSEIALSLIQKMGRPVAAPSANLFGYTSPTTARAVYEDLGSQIDCILDGGPTTVGIESTVVKFEGEECILLRPGGVTIEELERVLKVTKTIREPKAPIESPGLLPSHYAPWTQFTMMDKGYLEFSREMKHLYDICQKSQASWPRIGVLSFDNKKQEGWFETLEILSPQGDLREAAANLFHAIRKLDKMNLDLLIAENIPEKGLGVAIMDRLRKATAGKKGVEKIFAGEGS